MVTGTVHNWYGDPGGYASPLVINAGGMLRGGAGVTTLLGHVSLNGGIIEVSNGVDQWWGSPACFKVFDELVVTGSVVSTITTAPGSNATARLEWLSGSVTVNDVTGDAASDLIMSARIATRRSDYWVSKLGVGTLKLAAGATGTATPIGWQIDAGTLKTTAPNVLAGASVLSTSTASTFDLGGTTQTLPGLGGSGTGNGYRGTVTNGTVNLNGRDAYLREGTFTVNFTGSNASVRIGGDPSATVLLGGTNSANDFRGRTFIGDSSGTAAPGPAGTVKADKGQA